MRWHLWPCGFPDVPMPFPSAPPSKVYAGCVFERPLRENRCPCEVGAASIREMISSVSRRRGKGGHPPAVATQFPGNCVVSGGVASGFLVPLSEKPSKPDAPPPSATQFPGNCVVARGRAPPPHGLHQKSFFPPCSLGVTSPK